jgi:phosphoadenosine phosphosulfate reductase
MVDMQELTDGTIQLANTQLDGAPPEEILAWAWTVLAPDVAATSSFQTQSLPLLHLIARTVPDLPVYFLDTGFHFAETLAFRDALMAHLGVRVVTLQPLLGHGGFKRQHGELYRTNPDLCCHLNKVEPWQQIKQGLRGWISGIRRDQTANRHDTPILTRAANGQIKVCPLAAWSEADIWRYIHRHDLPVHPLASQGYLSIGCAPCTRPVTAGEESRAGRWAGTAKTECGLHLEPPIRA